MIEATPGFETTGEADSGHAALNAVAELHPDLVLLDVRMPDLDGVEVAIRIRAGRLPAGGRADLGRGTARCPAARTCGAATFVRKQDFGPSLLRRLWHAYGT